MPISEEMQAHLDTGTTSLSRCWAVTRRDGQVMGFTDHDVALTFDGVEFVPDSGLTAKVLEQTTGLSVDNTEVLGVLQSAYVTDADIEAGRYDGAVVEAWLVNWADVAQRVKQFKGTIGEIRRAGGAFQAELRGLTEALNQPQGRVYQRPCSAVLGDAGCQFDISQPGYATEVALVASNDRQVLQFAALDGFEDRWFEGGRIEVLSGLAVGLVQVVKNDRLGPDGRVVELWEPLAAAIAAGDLVRLEAGCDKRVETCRLKFNNLLNFQGFPFIPGEDWLMAVPGRDGLNDGGSLGR